MNTVNLIHKTTKTLISSGADGQDILQLNDKVFFRPQTLSGLTFTAKKGLGLNLKEGLVRNGDLKTDSKMRLPVQVKKCVLPAPWFPLAWGKLIVPRNDVIVDLIDESVPYFKRKLSLLENEIVGTKGDDHFKRIFYLKENVLTKIEARDEERSVLYKDKESGRFWQFFRKSDEEVILVNITNNQWAFEYIEQRELKKSGGGNTNPQEYMDSLQDDPNGETCEEEGCDRLTVKYSSLCRFCHYETVMGVPFDPIQTKGEK